MFDDLFPTLCVQGEVCKYCGVFTLAMFTLSGVDCTPCPEEVLENNGVFTLPVFTLSGLNCTPCTGEVLEKQQGVHLTRVFIK